MSNRKQRHLSPAGFLLALALLIVGIFAADYVYRLFFRSSTENIIGTGGFSTTSSSSGTASEDGENATDSTEETQPSGIVLQLTAADQASGPLVLADASHPQPTYFDRISCSSGVAVLSSLSIYFNV